MPLLHHALRWLAPATLAAALLATPAHQAGAAIISLSYTISATNFSGPVPVDPAAISFSISFDTTLLGPQTAGLTIHSANFPLGSHIDYYYDSFAGADRLVIGGGSTGALNIDVGDDFTIRLNNVSTTPTVFQIEVMSPAIAISTTTTLTPYEAPQDTPEPASVALFGVAMAALGTLRARRKHRQAA